jgi:hypothetical protein
MSPTVGCRVSTSKAAGISLGLGYSMQKLKGESIGGSEYDFKENIGGFTVRLGFDF